MVNRLDATFTRLAQERRKALVAFLSAGDPDYDTSYAIMRAACESGADILEIGVPFSDPTCDGSVIQAASERALRQGMTLERSFQLAADLRRSCTQPLVLFSYYNLFFKYGLKEAVAAACAAGIDALLMVDLPPEEAAPLRAQIDSHAAAAALPPLHLIQLIAPTTPPERMRKLTRSAAGFIYLISRTGVTGSDGVDYAVVERHAREVKALTPVPVCIGFGIDNAADAAALAPLADGIIVGSALVRMIASATQKSDLPALIAGKVAELRRGLDG